MLTHCFNRINESHTELDLRNLNQISEKMKTILLVLGLLLVSTTFVSAGWWGESLQPALSY